jgi:hypothetical protein
MVCASLLFSANVLTSGAQSDAGQGLKDAEISARVESIYEKIFCADVLSGQDIFDMRGIDRKNGCIVIVRPDQYVAPCPAPKRLCRPLGVLRRIYGGSEPRLKGAARRTANPCTPIRLLRGK